VERSSVRTQRLGNISQVEWFASEHHALLGGTDLSFDQVTGLPDSVLYGSHHLMNLGAYVQDECSLTERLTFTIGARVDHFAIPGEYEETNFSPKLALLFAQKKKWRCGCCWHRRSGTRSTRKSKGTGCRGGAWRWGGSFRGAAAAARCARCESPKLC
jgi:outer membrane receptor protein involved in Fe transport